jgi:hypothetical protein
MPTSLPLNINLMLVTQNKPVCKCPLSLSDQLPSPHGQVVHVSIDKLLKKEKKTGISLLITVEYGSWAMHIENFIGHSMMPINHTMPCTVHAYTYRQGSSSHELAGSTLITLPLIYSIVESAGLRLETVPGSGEMSEYNNRGGGARLFIMCLSKCTIGGI